MWHSIIGSNLIDGKSKKEIDQWVLVAFGILFVLMQLLLLVWFLFARRHVRELKKREKSFLDKLAGHNKLNENFTRLERL